MACANREYHDQSANADWSWSPLFAKNKVEDLEGRMGFTAVGTYPIAMYFYVTVILFHAV